MSVEIKMIEAKRQYYVEKRIALLQCKADLINESKKIEATAMDFAIDRVQEFIHDLTDLINEVESHQKHSQHCEDIINLLTNKKIKNIIN